MKSLLIIFVLVYSPVLFAQTPAEDDTLRHVNEIARQLIAPCCWSQTADGHQSDAAKKIKAQIRDGLRIGLNDTQIIDRFVVQYGEKIRAVPKAEGFNMTLWIFLVLASLFGVLVLTLYVRRMVKYSGTMNRSHSASIDKWTEKRVENELKELGE